MMTSKNMQRVNPNRSITVNVVFLVLLCSLLTFAVNAQCVSSQAKKAKGPSQSALREALQTSFGSAVEAVTTFKPFYLTADFNGDGAQDVVIAVRIKAHQSELAKDVKLLNPFERSAKRSFPADPAAQPTLALAIIHGGRGGWQRSPAGGKFLLLGESPIAILENDRATSGYRDSLTNLMTIITRRGVRGSGGWFPAAAKFDSINLLTEAAESILFWNGKTYRWEEVAGE